MCPLTLGWNELRKVLYVSQILLALSGAIFRGVSDQMTYTMMSPMYMEVGGRTSGRGIYGRLCMIGIFTGRKCVIGILECGCYI